MKTTKAAPVKQNRETWLRKAAARITTRFARAGIVVPADVRISCGFPGGGSARKRIGECWPRGRSAAKVNEVFISPVLANTTQVLDVLGHELLHAVDDCQSGHKGAFNVASKAVGYSGGKQSGAGTEMLEYFKALERELGAYPHGEVKLVAKIAKESNGLHGLECGCGNKVYSTAAKIELYGFPVCPACDGEMLPVERTAKKTVTTV